MAKRFAPCGTNTSGGQAITVARGPAGMVGCAITFNSQCKQTTVRCVFDREVNVVPRHADLAFRLVSRTLEDGLNLDFKWGILGTSCSPSSP